MIRTSLNRRKFIADISKGIVAAGAFPLYSDALSVPAQKSTGYVFDERFLDYSSNPETPARLIAIENRMKETGLSQEVEKIALLNDPLPYIKSIHSDDHIASIQDIAKIGVVAELAVAGALGAVQAVCEGTVRNAFCAIRPPGHHAGDGAVGEGFCYYNNISIAAKYAQAVYGYKKILIIDWDYHHGNATQDTFYEDPNVLFFSTHNFDDYPFTGDPALEGAKEGTGYNINVHLEPQAEDDQMKRAWEEKLLPKVDSFKPDFVLISAGFDSRIGDTIGKFRITDTCFAEITKMAVDIAKHHCDGRLVSFLEGGYNVEGLAQAVATHIETLINEDIGVTCKNAKSQYGQIHVRDNILYIPSSLKESSTFVVRNASGTVLKRISPDAIQNNNVSLSQFGLSAGNYFIAVKTRGQKVFSIPFVFLK